MVKKLFSRKLLAFLVATAGLWLGVVTESTWQTVAVAYLGAQGLVDLAGHGVGWLKGKAEGTAVEATPEGAEPEAEK
jgi:hypothetical protein